MSIVESAFYYEVEALSSGIMKLDWSEHTSGMDFDTFKEACLAFAEVVLQNKSDLLLISTVNFGAQLPDEFAHWKDRNLNPIYGLVPVIKMAYLLKPASYAYFQGAVWKESTYTNRYFKNEEEAIEWLTN